MATADTVFAAPAGPVRRQVLDNLRENGPRTAGAIAARFTMRRPSVSEYPKVLRDAGLVTHARHGRERRQGRGRPGWQVPAVIRQPGGREEGAPPPSRE
ncbi:ArsR/SmtB family transcription factor, partial [Streptomyces sp. NPDC058409]|uniref:ArsR/SmtB family transcription factor n=1 Tax=Streptomyces sp. NPDC058409 TaxID=3346484 RepID=UPI00365219E7